MPRPIRAFTLIELLIVVAIIAILAAIAVPNFLEAQVRSKVSRVRADQRSASVAIETYRVDHNAYPPHYLMTCTRPLPQCYGLNTNQSFPRLTTPIAYLTSIESTRDIFNENIKVTRGPGLPGEGIVWDTDYMFYTVYSWFQEEGNGPMSFEGWCLRSIGPMATDDAADWRMYNVAVFPGNGFHLMNFLNGTYDPTNGTVSVGDIARFGGGVPPQAAAVSNF